MSQAIFVKVSGDLFKSPAFHTRLKKLSKGFYTVVCVGGGTQINRVLQKRRFKVGKHGPLGRELKTQRERELARDVLNDNADDLRILLKRKGIIARVIIPVLESGPVICHVNGDQFVRTMYLGFEQLYVFTTKKRAQKKSLDFRDLPKVRVVGV